MRHSLICGLVISFWSTTTAFAADPTPAEARAALVKAVTFFHEHVSAHGGYVYQYSADLTKAEGEGKADRDTAWVQPPGTPAVGLAMLEAYERTGEKRLLEAARAAGDCLVKGQLHSGGWMQSIDFEPEKRLKNAYVDLPIRKKAFNVTSLDDNKTQSALRYLMRLDQVEKQQNQPVRIAVEKALASLLAAQFPNGAWPQGYDGPNNAAEHPIQQARFPKTWSREAIGSKYWFFYTLNDNTHVDTIDTVLLAHQIYGDEQYLRAAIRGGEFLLLAQLPDPQPAWAQQYNYEMEPVWARKFEPPAVTGGESQGAVQMLHRMYVLTGDRKFLDAAGKAIPYLEKSALPDGQLARFYELQTNRPLYFTKDYKLTDVDSDVPTHYGFKVTNKAAQLAKEQARLAALSESDLQAERAKVRKPSRPKPADVARIITALDDRGAWVTDGRLKHYGKGDSTTRVIASEVFIKNVETLSRFMELHR